MTNSNNVEIIKKETYIIKEKKKKFLFVTSNILWNEFISYLPAGHNATEKIEALILDFVMQQRNARRSDNDGKRN